MTAAAATGPQPSTASFPFADASPAQVRAALIPEDAAEFDRQWRAVMAVATETLTSPLCAGPSTPGGGSPG